MEPPERRAGIERGILDPEGVEEVHEEVGAVARRGPCRLGRRHTTECTDARRADVRRCLTLRRVPLEHRSPSGLPGPSGYSHVVRAGNLLFISGQVGLDAERKLVGPGDIVAQTRQVFANIGRLLADSGARWSDLAKLTIYLTDMRDIERVREVRRAVYAEHGIEAPATTTVEVNHLAMDGVLIEIEAIAVTGG